MMWRVITQLIKSPMSIAIIGFLTKWYIMIMVPAIIVTYYVFTGLEEAGFFDLAEGFIKQNLAMLQYFAKECPRKIMNFPEFLHCWGQEYYPGKGGQQ